MEDTAVIFLKKYFFFWSQYHRELGQEDGEEKQGWGGDGGSGENGSDLFFKSRRFFKFIE